MLGFAGIVGVFVWRGMVEGFFDVSYFGYPLNPTYGLSEKNGRGNLAPTVPLFGRLRHLRGIFVAVGSLWELYRLP